jgi:ABC-2 type transport system ATP-binding protein
MKIRDEGQMKSGKAGSIVELKGLTHTYGERVVLKGVDLTVGEGEIFGFLGHNGAGKTTTINILTTLLVPTSGSAQVCGEDVKTNAYAVRKQIGYLPENVRLYDNMSARENLRFFAELSGISNPAAAVNETLDFLESTALADRRLGTFSKGMRQRIGIAQAILHKPRVLFLDEPTSGLDPQGVLQLRETITRLNRDLGMTIFMNTHLLSEVSQVCTTIGVLNQGELIYNDTLENTLQRFSGEISLEHIYLNMSEDKN